RVDIFDLLRLRRAIDRPAHENVVLTDQHDRCIAILAAQVWRCGSPLPLIDLSQIEQVNRVVRTETEMFELQRFAVERPAKYVGKASLMTNLRTPDPRLPEENDVFADSLDDYRAAAFSVPACLLAALCGELQRCHPGKLLQDRHASDLHWPLTIEYE